ncbi:MAG: ABC transporter permease [Thermoleophilaceae bacterium]|nr:ABC transporter permease [Thermoleophilaceae bacterium]
MTGFRLFWHQFSFEWKMFWRNPASVFFSVGLPLVFLFLLGAVFGGAAERDSTYGLLADQYLVPAIMTLGIVSASFVNVAMTITYQREMGVLKRLRGTPLPTSVFVSARTASAVVNSGLIALVILLAGHLAYGIAVDGQRLLGTLIVVIVGSVSFCALGFALTIVIPNQGAATAITNMITLPLYFISGVFGDAANLPTVLSVIGKIFPIYHLGACLFETFSPDASGLVALDLKDLGIVAAWGAVGMLLASWKFRWEPQESR